MKTRPQAETDRHIWTETKREIRWSGRQRQDRRDGGKWEKRVIDKDRKSDKVRGKRETESEKGVFD